MTIMAEGTSTDQEDVPRAPPPSPELSHQQASTLDFTKLLAIDSLGNIDSPSSSTEHSRPTSPLFYHSPEHVPSRPLSPSYNLSKLSELTLATPSSYQEYDPVTTTVMMAKELHCGSLPVNGHMNSFPYQQQHRDTDSFPYQHNSLTSNSPYHLDEENVGGNGEHRRRKISLKRQHGDQEEYPNDVCHHGYEMKKLCHGKDRVGSAPPSHMARRSHTFSGSTNMSHMMRGGGVSVSDRDHMSLAVGSLPSNHCLGDSRVSSSQVLDQRSSGCLSPGGLKTVGFSTATTNGTPDEQMEGIETVEEKNETPPSIPISVTHSMDWSGGLSLSSNVTPTSYVPQSSMSNFSFAYPTRYSNHRDPVPPAPNVPSFSFNLTVPGTVSDSCPHNGFLTDQQDTSIPHISLDPHHFSKSL